MGGIFMSRKKKLTEEKIEIIERCVRGEISVQAGAREIGINKTTMREWINQYENEGIVMFTYERNKVYSEELKLQAVMEYQAGKGSLSEICKKYKIRSKFQLRTWIKVYNESGNFKRKMSGGSRMKSTRSTTQEERIKIAKESIENGHNYGELV